MLLNILKEATGNINYSSIIIILITHFYIYTNNNTIFSLVKNLRNQQYLFYLKLNGLVNLCFSHLRLSSTRNIM